MPKDIRKIHEEIYKILMEINYSNPNFTFTFRKSNRAGKLEQGYWFYGTDYYMAISFWTGMDWKNKTPNINFIVLEDGRTFLEIVVSDSEKKRKFVENELLSILKIKSEGRRYVKEYSEFKNDYTKSLYSFLTNDKRFIDDVIQSTSFFFEDKKSESIAFIDINDFEINKEKVNSYRISYAEDYKYSSEQSIVGFHIKNFGPIKDTHYIKIIPNVQWIFLVGENGTGKTSFLKALASGLCYAKIKDGDNAFIQIDFIDKQNNPKKYTRNGNQDIRKRKPMIDGFCSYGASRLKTSNEYRGKFSFNKALNKNGLTSSLFNIDTILIDIQEQLNYWNRNPNLKDILEKRKEFIKEVLIDILPKVYNITYNDYDDWESTSYIEKDDNDDELPAVKYKDLASGLKSLIAMIGDMMMRLFNQQPSIADPSELTGIVLIDEIDIHLHPNLQKVLVEQLTKTFPKVQFIVSTHSPIPLLGAPLNSNFFKVERNSANGVELTDLTEIGIPRLLPNAILTSDLFGMNQLFNRSYDISQIRTEDTYKKILFNDQIKSELKAIANKLKE
jgi:predicted ATPase